ncbi:MAG: hypothetical protein BWY84_00288 [Candidatus Aerophobetes bacterium ADurb.Bin490]|nr:MAG: hypothetical protein BWY84_00288 [Candidatus Aerophobetes bacterium ADurb.Bin490]
MVTIGQRGFKSLGLSGTSAKISSPNMSLNLIILLYSSAIICTSSSLSTWFIDAKTPMPISFLISSTGFISSAAANSDTVILLFISRISFSGAAGTAGAAAGAGAVSAGSGAGTCTDSAAFFAGAGACFFSGTAAALTAGASGVFAGAAGTVFTAACGCSFTAGTFVSTGAPESIFSIFSVSSSGMLLMWLLTSMPMSVKIFIISLFSLP